jgi:hypothetical protein
MVCNEGSDPLEWKSVSLQTSRERKVREGSCGKDRGTDRGLSFSSKCVRRVQGVSPSSVVM